ncbi:MAG: hypothetical protein QME79_09650 [Bacillota bacterium]|nr:hypothetical protein [Bacillota bacterium]
MICVRPASESPSGVLALVAPDRLYLVGRVHEVVRTLHRLTRASAAATPPGEAPTLRSLLVSVRDR